MKKGLISILLSALMLTPLATYAQLTVPQGGTGTTTFPTNYILVGSSALRVTAKSITALDLPTLSGNNTWLGINTFNGKTNLANASSTLFTISGSLWVPQTSAILLTGSGGLVASYAGTSCTNQFVRSLSALGAATCNSVANTDLTNSSVTYNGVTVALGASGTITAASSTLLADTNTFSTTATTTFSGNVKVSGNLQVLGNFFAPVNIVSSGDATINGALTVTGKTTLANASTTFFSASGFAALPTSSACGPFALGSFCVDTTDNQLQIGTSTSAQPAVLSPYRNVTFTVATSSWSGTTTQNRVTAPFSGYLKDFICNTDTGTVNAQFKVGSTNFTMFNASTTANRFVFSTSPTFVAGNVLEMDYGTPASSPTNVSCTGRAVENAT